MGVSHYVSVGSAACRKWIRGLWSQHCQKESPTGCVFLLQLDPTEKEWIYHAASARVPDLSQLLMQEPSLANKKVAPPYDLAYKEQLQ